MTEIDYSVAGMINWHPVEGALSEGTESGYKMAVIETHKMFSLLLKEKGFPGKDLKERLKNARMIFTNLEKLEWAIEIRGSILEKENFAVSLGDAKEVIQGYFQAILDVRDYVKKDNLGMWQKWKLSSKRISQKIGKWPKRILGGGLLFFFVVFLLEQTSVGQWLVKWIIAIAAFIFTKLILWALIAVAVIALLIAAWYQVAYKKEEKGIGENQEEMEKREDREEDE